jgi:hypothetical protein
MASNKNNQKLSEKQKQKTSTSKRVQEELNVDRYIDI